MIHVELNSVLPVQYCVNINIITIFLIEKYILVIKEGYYAFCSYVVIISDISWSLSYILLIRKGYIALKQLIKKNLIGSLASWLLKLLGHCAAEEKVKRKQRGCCWKPKGCSLIWDKLGQRQQVKESLWGKKKHRSSCCWNAELVSREDSEITQTCASGSNTTLALFLMREHLDIRLCA